MRIKGFNQNKIELNYNKIRITCDFEKSLILAIKEEFPSSLIQGCYFHYLKSLWKKCKKLGLTKSKYLKNTKLIVFTCKIYPFILEENKNTFINSLYEYANSLGGEFKNYIKYFKKNWEKSNFLNFDLISNGDITNRTNNFVESFHHKLNSVIEMSHPRISILVEKLIQLSKEYYYKYVNKIFNNDNKNIPAANIYNDIWNFLDKFLKQYKYNINFNLLLQDLGNNPSLEEITKKVLTELYNIENYEDLDNSSLIEQQNNTNNINNNDLENNWWFSFPKNDALPINVKKDNHKDDNEYKTFIVDSVHKIMKRNYNLIKNDIIDKLYNKNNEDLIISKKN